MDIRKMDRETFWFFLTTVLILGVTLLGMAYAFGRLSSDRSYPPDRPPPSKQVHQTRS